MKRISIALAAIGISVGAMAAFPAATNPTEVSIPSLTGGFVIGATGFYLQPSDTKGDLDYASSNVNNNSVTSATAGNAAVNLHNVDPGYDWGWGVNAGYIFPNTGNDVNLSYFHFDSTENASTSVTGFNGSLGQNTNGNFILPVGFVVSNGNSYQNVTATAKYELDQVDLTAGQYINVGCRLSLHPIAGVRWAQVDRKLTENYSAPGTSGLIASTNLTTNNLGNGTLTLNEKSDFEGIGPLMGLDASYYIGQGVGLVGHFDSALLVGNINSQTTEAMSRLNNLFFPSGQSTFNATYTANSAHRLVPVLDAKLGINYTYVFDNVANSDVTVEGGWQNSHYWNAVDRLQVVDGTGAGIVGRTTSSLALSGPYLSVIVHA
jgi:hypothetical protein